MATTNGTTRDGMNDALAALAEAAVTEAIRGAFEYLRSRGMTDDAIRELAKVLVAPVRAEVKAIIHDALHDARGAFRTGLGDWGTLGFGMAMRQAGIRAAKTVEARDFELEYAVNCD